MASARLCVCLQLLTLTRMSTQAGRAGSSSSGGARSLILRRYTQPASAQTQSTYGGTAQPSWQCCVRLLASTRFNTSSYPCITQLATNDGVRKAFSARYAWQLPLVRGWMGGTNRAHMHGITHSNLGGWSDTSGLTTPAAVARPRACSLSAWSCGKRSAA